MFTRLESPIPYGRQEITQEDIDAVVDTLKSDFLTQGPKIPEFEAAFARFIGAKYAIAVSSGTAALHLCALALNVNKKSNVITSPITFVASANCIAYCGGTIFFADIDEKTLLIDIEQVKKTLRKNPKGTFNGLVIVDFAGYPVNMEEVRNVADEFGLWIIEDACHAPGAYFTDSKGFKQNCGNGQYADLAIFSFHPVKHIACGEGGMITTNKKELYEKLLLLRTHGITKTPQLMNENHGGWYYEMSELGYNYRLTDIQAALGISQLAKANNGLKKRKTIAKKYDDAFKGTQVKTVKVNAGYAHAYHLYVIQVANRKEIYDLLRQNNIFAQVHYIPVHYMPFYKKQGFRKGDFPIAESYYEHCLSLPMYPALSENEQGYVIEKVLSISK